MTVQHIKTIINYKLTILNLGGVLIPKILKELRLNKGYTQEYMAQKLGYSSKSGYCMLENGLVKMTFDKAKLIAEILQIDPIVFFKEM